ncbi:MAG: hypothetical protein ACK5HT_04505, partial [Draconibacterium sp.]
MKIKRILKNKMGWFFTVLLPTCLFIGLFSINSSAQQTINVTGKVTTATDGTELPGVSITVKGASQGTVTDI